jgi:outer membrane protein TolC
MKSILFFTAFILITLWALPVHAQDADLDYYLNNALKNDAMIRSNINQQKFYSLQAQLINAQNKAPQVNFTSDYVFAPFFGDNGKAISITTNPSPNAFGYDVGQTNGGTYATQVTVSKQLLNKNITGMLQDQNKNAAELNSNTRLQLEHDIRKSITDQYIQVYQLQQQEDYLVQIVVEVKTRKATVEALVKRGLLQQSDYLLLEIEQNTRENELSQLRITEVAAYNALKNLAIISDTATVKLSPPAVALKGAPPQYFFQEKYRLDSLSIDLQQKVFNNKYRPSLDLSANGGMLASDFNSIPHNVGLMGSLHLAIPIFDGHQRKINDSQVKINQQNITYARDNFSVQQRNYLQSLLRQIELLNKSIVQIEQLISKQDLLLKLDQEKLQGGQLSIIEYIKSLQDYKAARQNLNAARVQLLLLTNQYNYYNW